MAFSDGTSSMNNDEMFQRFGPAYRWLVTLTVMTGTMALGLASSMVNVAVPSVIGTYGIGLDQAQWMSTAFLGTMAAIMLVSAWLIEVLGQRLTFTITMAVFATGSFLSATAPNYDILILGRALQGAATGVGYPLSMFCMFSVFPPERRGTALGIAGLISVLSPTFGPVFGGIMIDTISWRFLFFLPLPFCIVALFLGLIFLPGKKRVTPLPTFDWIGLGLAFLILFSIFSGLASGPRLGWNDDTILLRLLGGAVMIVTFIIWELRAPYPLLDLSLFRSRPFCLTMLSSFVFGCGFYASIYFIPVFVQTIQNYSATRAGLLLATSGGVMLLFFPIGGRVTDLVSAHIPVAAGLLIFSVGFFLIQAADVNTAFWVMVGYLAVNRVGLSLAMPALSAAALRAVPAEKLARGTSSSNFFLTMGGGFGVALFTAFFQYRTQFHGEAIVDTQTPANKTTLELLGGIQNLLAGSGMTDLAQAMGALNYLSQVVLAQASTLGFKDTFLAIAVVALLAVGPAWLIGGATPPNRR